MWTLLELRRKKEGHFQVGTVILGFLTIFKNCQASSTFEALNSVSLSRCQRDVRPIVEMRWRPRAFCRVSTGDSDNVWSCDMKDEPAIKPLQGNPAFFRIRHLGGHFSWSRKNRVPLTYVFLRENSSWGACGKFAYLFSWIQGIILIQRRYGVYGTCLKLLYWNWWCSILETGVSGNLCSLLNGVKPLVLYDVDCGMVMEPMQGESASSQFDLCYTKLFWIPEVTSVFFSS